MSRWWRSLATLAAAAAALASASLATATPAAAAAPCAAVVVDTGGKIKQGCTPWAAGMSGLTALRRTGHTITFRRDGLVCALDGFPTTGCSKVDTRHYWAYFHRAPKSSAWTYSASGPASYRVRNGETEGWRYVSGQPTLPKPRGAAFATICPQAVAKPKPAPKPPAHPAPAPPARPKPRPVTTAAAPTTGGGGTAAPGGQQRSTRSHAKPAAAATPGRSATRPATKPTPAPAGTSTSAGGRPSIAATEVSRTAAAEPPSDSGGGVPVAPLAGVTLAAGIAAAAVVRARRRGAE